MLYDITGARSAHAGDATVFGQHHRPYLLLCECVLKALALGDLLVRPYLECAKSDYSHSMCSNDDEQVRGEDSKKTYKIYIGDRQLCSCGACPVHHHDTKMMFNACAH